MFLYVGFWDISGKKIFKNKVKSKNVLMYT